MAYPPPSLLTHLPHCSPPSLSIHAPARTCAHACIRTCPPARTYTHAHLAHLSHPIAQDETVVVDELVAWGFQRTFVAESIRQGLPNLATATFRLRMRQRKLL